MIVLVMRGAFGLAVLLYTALGVLYGREWPRNSLPWLLLLEATYLVSLASFAE